MSKIGETHQGARKPEWEHRWMFLIKPQSYIVGASVMQVFSGHHRDQCAKRMARFATGHVRTETKRVMLSKRVALTQTQCTSASFF